MGIMQNRDHVLKHLSKLTSGRGKLWMWFFDFVVQTILPIPKYPLIIDERVATVRLSIIYSENLEWVDEWMNEYLDICITLSANSNSPLSYI